LIYGRHLPKYHEEILTKLNILMKLGLKEEKILYFNCFFKEKIKLSLSLIKTVSQGQALPVHFFYIFRAAAGAAPLNHRH